MAPFLEASLELVVGEMVGHGLASLSEHSVVEACFIIRNSESKTNSLRLIDTD